MSRSRPQKSERERLQDRGQDREHRKAKTQKSEANRRTGHRKANHMMTYYQGGGGGGLVRGSDRTGQIRSEEATKEKSGGRLIKQEPGRATKVGTTEVGGTTACRRNAKDEHMSDRGHRRARGSD